MEWKYWTNKKISSVIRQRREHECNREGYPCCAMSESGDKKQRLYFMAISRAKWNTA